MFKSAVYHGNSLIGEVEVHPMNPMITGARIREIRIAHFSPPSERCPPLAVLHTIAPAGVSFTMESAAPTNDSPLWSLHSTCIRENKTAVVLLGAHELHLVAMQSRKNLMQYSCFWGFYVAPSLYSSCLVMLNLRCLGIVFDLDETLIVANTMRSFEDKIDALQRKVNNEVDPQRVTGMMAEVKRYQDDKSILKQYIENDQVVENGKAFEVKSEVVPPLSDNHQFITRPIIRLQEKNIILTRVNPEIRDTSVLVRLRPAWEDLRSYLTAKGRKRFEVYVCTMAERDYAIEMWRLLDPEAKLISSRELLDRIVCVKSGYRKSLLSVFQEGNCHPKMSLVIDDRLKVWDEKDQSRVHVVPAFAPYYAPQAEANSSVPVLCVARNVACNVRGGFFKDFDEVFLPRIAEVFYEDQMTNFQSSPDVGKYLSEDDTSASNGNKDPQCNESMADVEMEKKLKDANYCAQAVLPVVNNFDSRVLGQPGLSEPSLQGSLATEEGEVRESELDPDMRRRLLILQHGQDTRHPPPPPPFSVRPPPLQVSVPPVQSCGSWYPSEEEIIPRQLKRMAKEFPLEPEAVHFKRKRSHHSSSYHKGDNFIPSDRLRYENQGLQVHHEDDWLRSNNSVTNYRSSPGGEMPLARVSYEDKDRQSDSGSSIPQNAETPASALQEIAMKCGTKVEFRAALFDTAELRFSVEVWFHGEKIGEGIGHTRKEAQNQAADRSLRNLANEYLSSTLVDSTAVREDFIKLSHVKENGFISDSNSFGYSRFTKGDQLPYAKTSEEPLPFDNRLKGSKNATAIVTALKELCTTDGYSLVFQEHPSPSISSVGRADVYAQVEIAGQILGKGTGTTWEEAKNQAAEEAFETLTSMRGQFTQKHSGSPRLLRAAPNKRWKQDFMPRIPSSGRYSKKEAPVP